MVDPVSLTLKVGPALGKWLAERYVGRNDKKFVEARDEGFRDFIVDLAQASRSQGERLDAMSIDIGERVARLEADREFGRILDNYGVEAYREAIDERRRMLAYAAAGSVNPMLTIAQLARVERTIRELDPADVKVLRGLSPLAGTGPGAANLVRGMAAYDVLRAKPPSGEILTAAGCVSIVTSGGAGSGPQAGITTLGRWVLEVLDCYLVVTSAESAAPSPDLKEG